MRVHEKGRGSAYTEQEVLSMLTPILPTGLQPHAAQALLFLTLAAELCRFDSTPETAIGSGDYTQTGVEWLLELAKGITSPASYRALAAVAMEAQHAGDTDAEGYDHWGNDANGFDRDGIHRDTLTSTDPAGFRSDGIHIETGTKFGPDGFDLYGWNTCGISRSGHKRRDYRVSL